MVNKHNFKNLKMEKKKDIFFFSAPQIGKFNK